MGSATCESKGTPSGVAASVQRRRQVQSMKQYQKMEDGVRCRLCAKMASHQSIVACYIVVSSHTRFTTNSSRHPTRPPNIFTEVGRSRVMRRRGGAHALSCALTKNPVTDARRARELKG